MSNLLLSSLTPIIVIADETTRATLAETALANDLIAESSARIAADAAEATARTAAIATASLGDLANNFNANQITVAGDIMPLVTSTLTTGNKIGSPTMRFKAIYVDEAHLSVNTLYLGTTPILGTTADIVNIVADPGQSINIKTSGVGNTLLTSEHGVELSSTGNAADVLVKTTGVGSMVRFSSATSVELTAPDINTHGNANTTGNQMVGGNLTVTGSLTVNGAVTTVNSTTVTTKDNIILVNAGQVGSGVSAGKAGISVDRGDLPVYQMVFDEADTMFKVGEIGNLQIIASQNFVNTTAAPIVHSHAAATTSVSGFMSAVDKTKLDNVPAGALVQSVGGLSGIVTKAQLGIDLVTNTADADKPVSTAQAAAIALVQTSVGTETAARVAADSTLTTAVSTAQSTANTAITNAATANSGLAAEVTARTNADATLTTNLATANTAISGEVTRATAAELTLTTNVAAANTAISTETTNRIAQDAATLAAAKTYADTVASTGSSSSATALTTETNARIAADALLVPQTTTVNGHALTANISITASDVGLGNVSNTSDLNKPVSTAQASAIAVETARAETAEATLTTNLAAANTAISNEVTRATAAEGLLVAKTVTVNGHALSANVTITSADVSAINTNQLGVASGVATLDAGGKLTTAQIPAALVGAIQYQGVWNASTNSPALASGVGTKGQYYKVSTVGATSIDGNANWTVGDLVIFDGSVWEQVQGGSSDVTSVAGRIGAVVLTSADVGLGNVSNTSDANKPVSTAQATADTAVQTAAATDATTKANAAQAAAIAASAPVAHVGSGGTAHAAVTTTVSGFMSSADKVKLDAITGTNTGDETAATIKTKLGITTLSGSNTGDQTTITGNAGTATTLQTARTIAGVSFDGSANIALPYANLTGLPTLGTAAAKNIPATGNASATEVVYGTDTRLTDSRPANGGNAATATNATFAAFADEQYCDATYNADAYTASYPNAKPTLSDGYRLTLGIGTTNATAAPTFAPTIGGVAQTPWTIVKFINNTIAPLAITDLQGDADLRCDVPNSRWILQNPDITSAKNTWTAQQTPMNGALTDGATVNWNADVNGQVVNVTLGGNRVMGAPTNIQQYAMYALRVSQDATGSRTITWNAAYKFGVAGAPTLSTAASSVDWLQFIGGAGNTLEFVGVRLSAV